MTAPALYSRLRKLAAPWQITTVDLDEVEEAVIVHVRVRSNARLACPQCNRICPRYDVRPRQWRHLDT
jgi:transposase